MCQNNKKTKKAIIFDIFFSAQLSRKVLNVKNVVCKRSTAMMREDIRNHLIAASL